MASSNWAKLLRFGKRSGLGASVVAAWQAFVCGGAGVASASLAALPSTTGGTAVPVASVRVDVEETLTGTTTGGLVLALAAFWNKTFQLIRLFQNTKFICWQCPFYICLSVLCIS
jgi:hypothetical protein